MGSCASGTCAMKGGHKCSSCKTPAPSPFAFSPFQRSAVGRTTGDPPPAPGTQVDTTPTDEAAERVRLFQAQQAREQAEREAQARREAAIGSGVRDAATQAFDAIRREQERARAQGTNETALELERIRQQAAVEQTRIRTEADVARTQSQNQASNLLAQRGISNAAEQLRLLEMQQQNQQNQQSWWDQRTDTEKVLVVGGAIAALWVLYRYVLKKGRR